MKRIVLIVFLLTISWCSFSQATNADKSTDATEENGWTAGVKMALNITQVSLTNWTAGGQSSLAINGLLNSFANYRRNNMLVENTLVLGYGFIKQGKKDFFKSDDRIELNIKVTYGLTDKISFGELYTFKSQMSNGYPSIDDNTLISSFLSPGYLIGALGFEYKPSAGLSIYLSPVASKSTIVMNQELSDQGSFGVEPGRNYRGEFGGYLKMSFQHDLMENVNIKTSLDLFSNYLDNPQFVDVNWDVLLMMKINKFLSASITTELIYDHDILIGKDTNDDGELNDFQPRVQFKELIGLGLSFSF